MHRFPTQSFRVNKFIADTSFPLARHIVGPKNARSLTLLGWTDNINILSSTMYPVHIQNNSPAFMCALYNIGHLWLGTSTISGFQFRAQFHCRRPTPARINHHASVCSTTSHTHTSIRQDFHSRLCSS